MTVTITEAGKDVSGSDFVDEEAADLGSIFGNVSEDVDNDNDGHDALSGVLVTLADSSDSVVATTLTDSEGNYVFCDLPSGDYAVTETDPDDLVSVSDVDGSDNTDNTVDVNIGGSSSLNLSLIHI